MGWGVDLRIICNHDKRGTTHRWGVGSMERANPNSLVGRRSVGIRCRILSDCSCGLGCSPLYSPGLRYPASSNRRNLYSNRWRSRRLQHAYPSAGSNNSLAPDCTPHSGARNRRWGWGCDHCGESSQTRCTTSAVKRGRPCSFRGRLNLCQQSLQELSRENSPDAFSGAMTSVSYFYRSTRYRPVTH